MDEDVRAQEASSFHHHFPFVSRASCRLPESLRQAAVDDFKLLFTYFSTFRTLFSLARLIIIFTSFWHQAAPLCTAR